MCNNYMGDAKSVLQQKFRSRNPSIYDDLPYDIL